MWVVRRSRGARGPGRLRSWRSTSPPTAGAHGYPPSSGRPTSAAGRGAAGRALGTRRRASMCSRAVHATKPGTSSRSSRRGTSAATRTTPCNACPSLSDDGRALERGEKVGELAAHAVELLRLLLQLNLELGLRVLERLDLRLELLRANLHFALLRLDGRGLSGQTLGNRVRLFGKRCNCV